VPDSGPLGCLDCSGTPSGTKQLDSCGVCGGDGLSCVSCTITDQSAKLFALDGNSLQISKDIKAIAKIAKSCKPSSKKKNAQVSTIQKQAQVLHVVAWEATWLNPTTQQSCQGASVTAVCVTTSFAQPIAKYQSTLLELQSLADSASSFAKKSCKGSKPAATKINKLLKRAKKLTVESRSLSDTLQTETQSCN
jgi:hypothetical protein